MRKRGLSAPTPFPFHVCLVRPTMCSVQEEDIITAALAGFLNYAGLETDAAPLDQAQFPFQLDTIA
jgi:hypothetical protein